MELWKTKKFAKAINKVNDERFQICHKKMGRPSRLAILLLTDDPSSHGYAHMQKKTFAKHGVDVSLVHYPADIPADTIYEDVIKWIEWADGVFLHRPLYRHLDYRKVLGMIPYTKDIEGLKEASMGGLVLKRFNVIPATAWSAALIPMLYGVNLAGKKTVVIGRSPTVGMPLSILLTHMNATVSTVHSKTPDITEYTKMADIVFVAVGRPRFLKGDMIREGSYVVDIGIHYIGDEIVGDVDAYSIEGKAAAYTPVPGGVGTLTSSLIVSSFLKLLEKYVC